LSEPRISDHPKARSFVSHVSVGTKRIVYCVRSYPPIDGQAVPDDDTGGRVQAAQAARTPWQTFNTGKS